MSYNQIETGKRIYAFRQQAGITRAQLAESLNISTSHLQKIELGARGISVDLIVDIADLYEISTDYLLRGSNYETASKTEVKRALNDMICQLQTLADNL